MKCYVYFIVTVIDQPDNVTVCLGGTVVFTCVMDITNVSISEEDVKWWRIRTDHAQSSIKVRTQLPKNTRRYKVTNTINNKRLNSTLMITNVISTLNGSYWPGLMENSELCDMAFLSIIGKTNYVYRDDYNGLTSDIFQTILLNVRPLIHCLSNTMYGCLIKLGTNVAINGFCPIVSENL